MTSAAVLPYFEVRIRLKEKRIVSRHYQCVNEEKARRVGQKVGHVISVSKVQKEDIIGVLNIKDILANNPPRPGTYRSFNIREETTLDDVMRKH